MATMKKRMFCVACGSDELAVYYPTPEAVARTVIEMASIDSDRLTVLEPSAGLGDLARLALERTPHVDCVEIQPALASRLDRSGQYRNVRQGDFLELDAKAEFDRIVMNPPFEKGADMAHVEHAMAFLRPGGVLVAVVSAMSGRRERRADKAFARRVDPWTTDRQRLPGGAFAEVGTNVVCDILRLEVPGSR